MKTFSNLDHHFVQHDGFEVTKKIELGRSDTINSIENSFNRFVFDKQNGTVTVDAAYSEDPLYINGEDGYRILSVNYPAIGHFISFQSDGVAISIGATENDWFELKAGEEIFKKQLLVKKGISCWSIFRDEDAFINSTYYNNEKLVACLKNILFLRDDVSRKKAGELKYFLPGRLFNYENKIKYDEQNLKLDNQRFKADLPDRSTIAWGIGFLDNNRNQYQVKYAGSDSFSLISRYPLAYPLSEENRNDWNSHRVSKFLLSDAKDMHRVPAVFMEGFLFSSFNGDNTINFSPLLLSYQKDGRNSPLQLKVQLLDNAAKRVELKNDKLLLPSRAGDFNWAFSIRNTYDWDFGNYILSGRSWQGLLFGSLGLFFLLVFFTSLIIPANRQSWVWQLLTCITMILLTTRFFLYWRYKTFPPYEGMDLPSQQQLQSFSNFGIIIFAVILLALTFGFGFLRYAYTGTRKTIAKLLNKSYYPNYGNEKLATAGFISALLKKFSFVQRLNKRSWFFITWALLLVVCGAIAGLNHFDAGICRHLAIGLMIAYFIFLFISYKYSPLVVSGKESWWGIGTGNFFNIVISNPVKILLSVSLLALFVFIDIGFAIVFLNFLFFNEAFLCVNYGIAGLSAGSNSRDNATMNRS